MIHVIWWTFLGDAPGGDHTGRTAGAGPVAQAMFPVAGAGGSVLLCALVDPAPYRIDVRLADGICAAVRHADRRISAAFHQHQQVAASAVAGHDHGTPTGAFHQVRIRCHAEPAGFMTSPACLVAGQAVGLQDGLDVARIAHGAFTGAAGKSTQQGGCQQY